jgi:hypothetical protein
MKRIGLVFTAALISASCGSSNVTLSFPDFPEGVAVIDLGETLTIDVEATKDGGMGVTWKCAGDPCTTLTQTPASVTFTATGLSGTATITARSLKQTDVAKKILVIFNLNDTPDLLCAAPPANHAGPKASSTLPGTPPLRG